MVENWLLRCSDAQVVSLSEPTFPGDEQHFKVASSLHARQRLRDWVFSENVCKGLAPANADVALKYEELVEAEQYLLEDARADSSVDLTISRHRKWFQRWRVQYDINIGKIQTRDAFTRAEIYSKAFVQTSNRDI